MKGFKDHFSDHAEGYRRFRPGYPAEWFRYLASLSERRDLAWDVGTGNGQAARGLAEYFSRVIATDASREQIAQAVPEPGVEYRVAPAEQSGLSDGTVDLITVATAAHWFDLPAFYREVRRVARPGAWIALWSYGLATVDPAVDKRVLRYYDEEIGRYWPAERRWVDEGYRTLDFPFEEVRAPSFYAGDSWDCDHWLGYLYTWSGTRRAVEALGPGIFERLRRDVRELWGDPSARKPIRWPLHVRVGKV